jgi:phenylacetate-CoA ligase
MSAAAVDLLWPKSRTAIADIQRKRKRAAVEAAKRAPFYRGRLDGVDLDRLDDPEVWNRIPLLTKDELRTVPADAFHDRFCVAPRSSVVEYWRSGGVTGRPLFYPRSADDMRYALLTFKRGLTVVGATPEDCAHISFPLGIHPVAHLYARAAEELGIGTVWAGSGNNTPSEMQLALIGELKPTIWCGMGSYGLHLANLAEAKGIDLAASSVNKIVVAAEPLSPAKREKLERMWGAQVFDQFGMTEGALVSCESVDRDGLHLWSDLFFVEIVDEATGAPVAEGEAGSLVITPLYINSVTPFLRWVSGDVISMTARDGGSSAWSVFPVMRHARRTVGFFKVRGVNVNHAELEDLMFRNPDVIDFKAEVSASAAGLDVLSLFIEVKRGLVVEQACARVRERMAATFQVTPEIKVLDTGTLGREFEASVKAARFVDRRG